ncbi:MAG: hypothetical protein GX591_02135 [Planctomycetes bacterium]|nr:hypothetical protein [Planctomycetota bacterium]
MEAVNLGSLEVSRLILGGNPFSGFSHQSPEDDRRMRRYYTVARIKETLRHAESLGITTLISRADNHIVRLLEEYWDEGGTLRWIAQTCPERGNEPPQVGSAIAAGAKGVFVHGGTMDYLLAQHRMEAVRMAIDQARGAGLAVGVAGHTPAVFQWAEANLDLDFYMCSYYNPTSRAQHADHVHGAVERFHPDDRSAMAATIATLKRPVIHYKVLAAGRNDPADALAFVRAHWRDGDAVCIGHDRQKHPEAMKENAALLGLR